MARKARAGRRRQLDTLARDLGYTGELVEPQESQCSAK